MHTTLHPLLLAMLAGVPGLAHAGSCNVTNPSAVPCYIPPGVASVNVVVTGGGGGAGGVGGGGGRGGAGGVVTTTLSGVGNTTLYVNAGGGGRGDSFGGGGGGSSSVHGGSSIQIIAGGGGGGGTTGNGGDGNGGAGGGAVGGAGGAGGSGGFGGAGGAGGGNGASGNGGQGGGSGGSGGSGTVTSKCGGQSCGTASGGSGWHGGGGGGGYGGGGGGGNNGSKCNGYICGGGDGGGGGGGGSTGGSISIASNGGVPGAGNGGSAGNGGNGSVVITWIDPPNTAPVFLTANPTLTVPHNAGPTDITGLLHISDTDAGQPETWGQAIGPSNGSLNATGARANSGSTNIAPPAGSITYTPVPGYAGPDSFIVNVYDGIAPATVRVNVTISNPTISLAALTLNNMTVGNPYFNNWNWNQVTGGYGPYAFSIVAGALPAGLTLDRDGFMRGTPTASGAFSFTVRVTDSSTGTGPFSQTRVISGTVAAAGTPPPPGTPAVTPPLTPSIATAVTVKDLTSGSGPSMAGCLTNAVTTLLGAAATYQGQNADGSARFRIATSPVQTVSFYPVDANSSGGNPALTLGSSNQLTVSSSCATFTTVPALFNSSEFAALASSMGLSLSINAQGVITGQLGGTTYVARPDYVVTQGPGGAPGLTQGADGLYRFTDSAGNTQVLRPAFLSPGALQVGAGAGLGGGSLVIQIDGTALFTQSNGTQSVLSPDMVLGPIPAAYAQANWWTDGASNRFRYPVGASSQGLTKTAK